MNLTISTPQEIQLLLKKISTLHAASLMLEKWSALPF